VLKIKKIKKKISQAWEKKKKKKKNSPSGEGEGLRALFGICMINE